MSGLTIGALASELKMSKSGLFAHFGSKEDLQKEVIDMVVQQFNEQVVKPSLQVPAGKAQIIKLVTNWIAWSYDEERPGGCSLAAAAFEYDAEPGEIRDKVATSFKLWRRALKRAIDNAKLVDLPEERDTDQIIRGIFGIYLSQHLHHWLLDEEEAGSKALLQLEALLKPV